MNEGTHARQCAGRPAPPLCQHGISGISGRRHRGRLRLVSSHGDPERAQVVAGRPAGFPVSIKGVVVQHGKVLLVHNERDEWELPGGKIDVGETPEACLVREVEEEVGWQVQVGPILDAWLYHIREGRDVLIVTYGCATNAAGPPGLSEEHSASRVFDESEIGELNMPAGYKQSILGWFGRLRNQVGSDLPSV
jgi:mutator protein MutT